MARVITDCIIETSTTTGTGAFTLAGPLTGFEAFSTVCSVGDRVYYMIEAVDGSGNRTGAWEAGFGTYSAAAELTRTTVHRSSNANAAVNFAAGTKRVAISYTAADNAYKGALSYKAGDLTAQNLTTAAAITWDTDEHDTHAFHDTGSNTSRMTVPAGLCKRIQLRGQVSFSLVTADVFTQLTIYKNGSAAYPGVGIQYVESGTTTPVLQVETAVITPADGDYFELYAQVETDTSVTIVAASSWFQLEVVE